MQKLTDQQAAVVTRLREGPLTQDQARPELGVAHLASRISELRDMGYRIEKEMIPAPTRHGKRKRTSIARYELKGEPPSRPVWSGTKTGEDVPAVEIPPPSDIPLPNPKRKSGVDVVDDQFVFFGGPGKRRGATPIAF